jgi:hypothetical protein
MPTRVLITSTDRPTLHQVLGSLKRWLAPLRGYPSFDGGTWIDLNEPGDGRGDFPPLLQAHLEAQGLVVECRVSPQGAAELHQLFEQWLTYLSTEGFADTVQVQRDGAPG